MTRHRAKILVRPKTWRDKEGHIHVEGGVFDGEGQGIGLEISSDAVSGAFLGGWTAEELLALADQDGGSA